MIQEFIAWQIDKKIEAASTGKQQLGKQLEIAPITLEKAETGLKEFAKKAGIVSLDSRLNLVYRELEETNIVQAAVGAATATAAPAFTTGAVVSGVVASGIVAGAVAASQSGAGGGDPAGRVLQQAGS